MVRDWLASMGKDGPALPVPDENYYPDYADPNMQNALAEIEDLQEAYAKVCQNSVRLCGKK